MIWDRVNEISRVNSSTIGVTTRMRKVRETCSLCCHYNANVCAWQYTIHFLFTLVFRRFLSQSEAQFSSVVPLSERVWQCAIRFPLFISSRHVLYSRVSQSLHLRTSLLFSVLFDSRFFTRLHESYWRYWKIGQKVTALFSFLSFSFFWTRNEFFTGGTKTLSMQELPK